MEFKDYYQILGLEPDASVKEIKTAYRKLAHKYHPDMNPSEGAEAKFKEVAEAYHVLNNPKARAEFDELRQYGGQSPYGFEPPPGWQSSNDVEFDNLHQFGGDFSDFFNAIFGAQNQSFTQSPGAQPQGSRGQDIEIELPIFLEENLKAHEKSVEFTLPEDPFTHTPATKKHLKVKIPKGVSDGARIRLKGQGKPAYRGGVAGDLYLHIRIVPHPLFDVAGHNLNITVPVAPWEAVLGAKITVPTLDGKISLSIPPNSQSGDKLRIKGKGLQTKTITGDLFAIIKIVLPEKSSEQTKELWQKLAANAAFEPRKEWRDK